MISKKVISLRSKQVMLPRFPLRLFVQLWFRNFLSVAASNYTLPNKQVQLSLIFFVLKANFSANFDQLKIIYKICFSQKIFGKKFNEG